MKHEVIVTILFVHERGNSGTLRAATPLEA